MHLGSQLTHCNQPTKRRFSVPHKQALGDDMDSDGGREGEAEESKSIYPVDIDNGATKDHLSGSSIDGLSGGDKEGSCPSLSSLDEAYLYKDRKSGIDLGHLVKKLAQPKIELGLIAR